MTGADYIAVFNQGANAGEDCLQLPAWGECEWRALLSATVSRPFKKNEMVIQSGAADRTLSFVVAGQLEVGINYAAGISVGSIAHIPTGSVVGEQSFFDAQARSANVWAIRDGELLCLPLEKFEQFAKQQPALACDLLFALGRILSLRLRSTMQRMRR